MTKTEKANGILLTIYEELKDGDLYEETGKIVKWVERVPLRKHKFSVKLAEIVPDYYEFCKLMVQLLDNGFIKTKKILEEELIKSSNINILNVDYSYNFYEIQITELGVEKCNELMEGKKITQEEKANEILLAIYEENNGDIYQKIQYIDNSWKGGIYKNHYGHLIKLLEEQGYIKWGKVDSLDSKTHITTFQDVRLTQNGKLKCEPQKEEISLNNTNQIKMKEPKIFISHSSDDKDVVGKVIDILEAIGVPSGKIFCSSFEGYGVKLGEDFLERIKKELDNDVMVLFILTSNFYKSPISLCEMGASWVKTNKQILILIPPFKYDEIKGVFPTLHSMKINEQSKLNSLKDVVSEFMGLETLNTSIWESKRTKILKEINEILNKKISKPFTIENNPDFWMGKS